MRLKNLLVPVVLLFYFAAFVFRGAASLDPDFGWHIRVGQYILSHGIAYRDPFSYSMSSYLFVDHEWLTNIIWAVTLAVIGYWPLIVVYALFAITAILLQLILTEKKWLLLPVFLVGGTLFDFVGVRTQVVDWLFLSILLVVLFKKEIWDRWRFFLPLLFLLWANVHGGFGIGIGVLGLVLLTRSFEKKKEIKKDILLFLLCLFVTLLNPFGIRLWGEFWSQLSDTRLHWTIDEWYPAIYFTNIAFWVYVVVSVFLIVRYRRQFSLSELTLFFLLFVAGLSSMRNIPLWMVASLFLTVKGLTLFAKEASQYEYGEERFVIGYNGFFIIVFILFFSQLGLYCYGVYTSIGKGDGYPSGAVRYLHQHLPSGQIFSLYGWGGYLLWKLPEKKDFIDGRMPSWRWNANIPGESNYALNDYLNILGGETEFAPFSKKFHITTILVPTEDLTKPNVHVFGFNLDNNSLLKKLFFLGASNDSFYGVITQAKKMGWKEVYNDSTSTIFEE